MGIIRLADTPMITGQSKALRSLHPDAKDGPVIWLPMGWEPHWTCAELEGSNRRTGPRLPAGPCDWLRR